MVASLTVAKFEPNTNYERNTYLELSDRHRVLTIAVLVFFSVKGVLPIPSDCPKRSYEITTQFLEI